MGRSATVFEPVSCEPGSCTWPDCSNFLASSSRDTAMTSGLQAATLDNDHIAVADVDGPAAASPRREYRSIAQRRLRSTLLPEPVISPINAVADRSNETPSTVVAVAGRTTQVSHTRNSSVSHAEVSHVVATGTMLPPRLSTPVPTSRPIQNTSFLDSESDSPLTSLGRRTLLRAQLGTMGIRSRLERLDLQIDRGALDRAQHAIDGSRSALSQARDAIRNALVHSERLERIAAILRRQVSSLTPAEAASARQDLEALDNARSELNLERALADLRAASVEIDRVIALSRESGITLSDRTATSGLLGSQSIALHGMSSITVSTSTTTRPAALRSVATSPRHYAFSSLLEADSEQSNDVAPLRMPTPLRAANPVNQLAQAVLSTSREVSVPSTSAYNPLLGRATATASRTTNLRDFRISTATDLARRVHEAQQASRTANATNEATLAAEEADIRAAIARASAHATLRRHQRQGGWRRLDANGDEIEGDVEEAPGRSLGWHWRPPSPALIEGDDADEDKPAHRASLSLDWVSEGRPTRSPPTSDETLHAARFDGRREMVGR